MQNPRDVSALASPESSEVLDDLRRIVRALRQSSRVAERTLGVSGAQLFVLRSLSGARALSLNELAARTRTHQSTVSVVVKRLVESALVVRVTSEVDGRRVELSLSKRGRALLERAPLAAQDKLIEGVERLPQKDRRVLASSLRRLVLAMQLADEQPSMFFEEEELAPSDARAVKKGKVRRATH
ncbi:MAG: transcriptional regulator, MarR family [Myxococcaceae bacterium]|nr:transcriptional regulator, MarR family [Myxococcaceae bacterium]